MDDSNLPRLKSGTLRNSIFWIFALTAFTTCLPASAQFLTPGPNTNVVGITPDVDGDPTWINLAVDNVPDYALKQQQEPSCIVSSTNGSRILCAFNDMRASDEPLVQGDGFIGVSMTGNRGDNWFSRLTPGYLGHPNSLGVGFAADPGLVEIPGTPSGLAVLTFIGGFRDVSDGVFVAQRYVEYPQEDVHFWRAETGVHYIALGSGGNGRFVDKPATFFLVDDPSTQSSTTETITVEGGAAPVQVTTPSGILFAAYAIFTGGGGVGNSNSQIWISRSFDSGKTWADKTKLTEDQNEVTGISLTAIRNTVVAVWRRKGDNNENDAIMAAYSLDRGNKWSKGSVAFDLCPFDQPATGASFRTFSFPWVANDGQRFWLFAADRRFGSDNSCTPIASPAPPGTYSGNPRIVGMSSLNGQKWVGNTNPTSTPFVVDPDPKEFLDDPESYQMMPAAFGTKGRVDVAWYDTRREVSSLRLFPEPAGSELPFVYDYLSYGAGGAQARVYRTADVYLSRLTGSGCGTNPNQACNPTASDSVRVTQFPYQLGPTVSGGAQVGQEMQAHRTNLRLYASGTLAFKGDYIALASPAHRKIKGNLWIPNSWPKNAAGPDTELAGYVDSADVVAAWGDNRDVVENGYVTDPSVAQQLPYSPTTNATPSFQNPGLQNNNASPTYGPATLLAEADSEAGEAPGLKAVTEPDDDPQLPTDIQTCSIAADFSRARDGNVRFSYVSDKPTMTSSIVTKPFGVIPRMFPIEIHNPYGDDPNDPDDVGPYDRTFCLAIPDQPAAPGRASFFQYSTGYPGAPAPVVQLEVEVPARSTVSRAVFVSGNNNTVVTVNAYEGACPASGPIVSSMLFADGPLFDPGYCDAPIPADRISACALVSEAEIHNISLVSPSLQAPVLQAPVLQNPTLQAPSLQNPGLQAPVLQAPSFQAPSFQAPSLQNPTLQAPTFQAPSLQNSTLLAPSLQAPSLQNGSLADAVETDPESVFYQDITYVVEASANVATTYSADVAIAGLDDDEIQAQLIAWIPSIYATTANCMTVPMGDSQIIAAVDLSAPNLQAVTLPSVTSTVQNPYAGEISFTGRPGDNIALTVRIYATGTAASTLQTLQGQYDACVAQANLDYADDLEALAAELQHCSVTEGAAKLISFGASSQSCSTENIVGSVSCLIADDNETIFQDMAGPLITPPDGSIIELQAQSAAGATLAASATDPSGIASFSCSSPSAGVDASNTAAIVIPISQNDVDGNPIPIELTCEAEDTVGNVATSTSAVFVLDTTPPVLTVPVTDVVEEATSIDGAIVNYAALVSATDNIGLDGSITCVPASGSQFSRGTTPVSCEVSDLAGNTDSDTFFVKVLDTVAPTLEVTSGLPLGSFEATGPDGAVVDYLAELGFTATDVVAFPGGEAVTPDECTPANNSLFGLGVTNVTCSIADLGPNATGGVNTGSVSFNVEVGDSTAPVITVYDLNFTAYALPLVVDYPDDFGAADSVDGDVDLVCDYPSGSSFTATGDTTVTCTATDLEGNEASDSFTVSIQLGLGIVIDPIRGRINASSTIPIDWRYYDIGTGQTIDSATYSPSISWVGPYAPNSNCSVPLAGQELVVFIDSDSGSSNFRYSASTMTWQYSLQTSTIAGGYKLTVTPPGEENPAAQLCLTTR